MHGSHGFHIKSLGGRSPVVEYGADEGLACVGIKLLLKRGYLYLYLYLYLCQRPLCVGIKSGTIIETGAIHRAGQTSRLCANEPF